MFGSYIPSKDTDLDTWALNFNTVLSATPTDFGLDAPAVASFTTLRVNFENALTAATDPGTRTSVTVAAKDDAKTLMVTAARQLAQIAQSFPDITSENLSLAGLTVRDRIPTPIPAPVTQPVLSLFDSGSLQLSIRWKDSILSNPRAKPQGVIGCRVYQKIGSTPPASIADCDFVGQFGKVPAVINYGPAAGGETIHFLAQWVTRRNLVGPTSDVFSVTCPA